MTRYKPSDASKENEEIIKAPLINEYNIMGGKFREGVISQEEWENFKKEWKKTSNILLSNAVDDRIYVEDISGGV